METTQDKTSQGERSVQGADQAQPQTESCEGSDRRNLPFVQLIPNLVTLLGLCAGLTSIRYALQSNFETAAALIVLAAIVDGMDGLLARKLNAASHFGAELDSLSDFVCFGVAPALLVFVFALHSTLPGFGWLFMLVFTLCACLRLARFNVARDAPPPPGRAHFIGVPAPAGALLALLPVCLTISGWVDMRDWPMPTALFVAGVGLLMVSRLPTPSPKGIQIARKWAIWVLLGVAVLAGAIAMRPWTVIVLADLAYLVVLFVGSWQARRKLT